MRYELAAYEWPTIKPMLPNKPRGVPRDRRQSMGRSRGGLTSKIHAVVDSNGLPVRPALSSGEAHDVRLAGKLLSRPKAGSMLLADRGYDADWIRELAMKKGAWAHIPPSRLSREPCACARDGRPARSRTGQQLPPISRRSP